MCRDFFLLLFTNQENMQTLDWSEALKSNIWSVKMVLSCTEFSIWSKTYQIYMKKTLALNQQCSKSSRAKKLSLVVYLELTSIRLYKLVLKCGPGKDTPPSMPTCPACFPLEISKCVGKRIGVYNSKRYRKKQNVISLFIRSN